MALTPFGKATQTLGTSATLLLSSPSNTITTITGAVAFNTSGATVEVTFYRSPSGTPVTTTATEIGGPKLTTRESYSCPELVGRKLHPGEALYAKADTASAINITLDGFTQPNT